MYQILGNDDILLEDRKPRKINGGINKKRNAFLVLMKEFADIAI